MTVMTCSSTRRNELLPLVREGDDPLGIEDLTTHQLPLKQAPDA
jgi:hypothetical protein